MWLYGRTMLAGVWFACIGTVLALLCAAALAMLGLSGAATASAICAGASFVSGIALVLVALTMDTLFD